MRVVRYFGYSEGLKLLYNILHALAKIFNNVINVSLLTFIFMFAFSTLGMQLFAKTAYYGEYNEHANFRTFYRSMLTMLRMVTFDNWSGFMFDASHKKKNCDANPSYNPEYCGFSNHADCKPLNGCGSVVIFPFMITFIIFVGLCLMNLFVAMVLEVGQRPASTLYFSFHYKEP